MAKKETKDNNILVRNISEETYSEIVEIEIAAIRSGDRKSLGLIALELIEDGLKARKKKK
jgi:hypothetical protein